MGLNFVFFNIRLTSSCEIESTKSNSTALSDNNRKLHWLRPSGGVEHANAVIFALTLPSNKVGAPGLDFSLIAALIPL